MLKKKIITFILLIIVVFSIILYTNKKENNNKITLSEVTHSPFYTPLYIAIENGYFEEEGIELELVLTPGADKVSAAILSNDAQIGFAGAESALYIYDKNEKDYLEIFAGLTQRDGQFIVSKNKEFKLTDLYNKEIIVGRSTGMPALNFIYAMKKNNIDINKININYSIDYAALSGAFIGGTGDFVNLFEPNALALEKNGYGYSVESIGMLSGEMPYTVFYAKKSFIDNNKDLIVGFTKAINKGLEFVLENDAKTCAKIIQPQFSDLSLNDLTEVISRYKENDSWLKTSFIPKSHLDNLENLLLENKLISKKINYDEIIKYYK